MISSKMFKMQRKLCSSIRAQLYDYESMTVRYDPLVSIKIYNRLCIWVGTQA